MKRLLREIALFGLVGGAGFVVDSVVLYALRDWLGPLAARVPSFLLAVLTTWWLNRRFTFRQRPSGLQAAQEFRRYLLLMLSGGAVNYAVFAVLILVSATARLHPVLAIAAGSIAGMGVNLLASRLLLFR
jgi:putative flippase GtrA